MGSSTQIRRRLALLASGLLIVLGCAVAAVLAWPEPSSPQRLQAQARWAARPFAAYRIAVRVEFAGNVCAQELETSDDRSYRIIANSCRSSWLSTMTVARLFEISERLDQPIPCYATLQTCLCQRVRLGQIAYDSRLGYPALIAYRREVRPNLANLEYWRRLVTTRSAPSCGPSNQEVRIGVTSLTPLGGTRQ